MTKIKIEPHFHTKESSPCGGVYAADGIRLLKKHSYNAVIVTDHFTRYSMALLPGISYAGYVDWWIKGYENARNEGEKSGIKVFLGMEITLGESRRDYLVYGISKALLLSNENLFDLNEAGLKNFCDVNGLIVFQAHPFRSYSTPGDPRNLHGVETYNGNQRHDNNNDLAEKFAEEHHLLKISGSDFHQIEDAGQGGIFCSRLPVDNAELAQMLKSGEATPVTP